MDLFVKQPIGLVMELRPTIYDDGTLNSMLRRVMLTCKYRAPEPLAIKFFFEGREVKPTKNLKESKLYHDGWHGEHVLHTVWDTRRRGEIFECHTITERGFTLGVLSTSLPESGSIPAGVSSIFVRPRVSAKQVMLSCDLNCSFCGLGNHTIIFDV